MSLLRRSVLIAVNAAILLCCCSFLNSAGCSSAPRGTVSAVNPPMAAKFKIGAAIGDITPPPGYPMGGHSIAGEIGRGYWLRPRVRAIYIQDQAGHALALVSCELWSFPAGLGDRIAELLASDNPRPAMTRAQLLLCATHTHHSPGNFSSSAFYNAYGSKEGGFDPLLFEFLAGRITRTIEQAKASARDGFLSFAQTRMRGIARNRSFDAFMRDPEAAEILKENEDLPLGRTNELFPAPEAFRAIDPTMSVLKLTAVDGQLVALAVFAATHPTTMSHDFLLYSGELYGAVSLSAERRLALKHPGSAQSIPQADASEDAPPAHWGPVVAMFNGAEGDVSPYWEMQGRATTMSLADRLAQAVLDTAASPDCKPIASSSIEQRFEVCRLAGATYMDAGGASHPVDDVPIPGVGTFGGAEDGMTLLHRLGWKERITGTSTPSQGDKQPALDIRGVSRSITRSIISRSSYPAQVPLGIYRIGDLTLATLPGEFTTVMGRRVRISIADAIAPVTRQAQVDPKRVLLVGLADEYVSYFATPEEYALQDYEGASTLFGPWSGPFIQQELTALAGRPADRSASSASAAGYDMGPQRRFSASSIAPISYWTRNAYADVLQNLAGQPLKDPPMFDWSDAEPCLDPSSPGRRPLPDVWIQQLGRDGRWVSVIGDSPETDQGLDIAVILRDGRGGTGRWSAYWMPPARAKLGGRYRFSVRCVDDTVLHSQAFALKRP